MRANSAGSPASRSSTNCTPLTTRPASTSRQAMIRLESTEVLQDPQADCARFFGMKLHPEDVVAFHSGGERSAIFSRSHGMVDDRSAIRVCIVHERAVFNAVQ